MKNELEPCPFCGNEAEIVGYSDPHTSLYWPGCFTDGCPARRPSSVSRDQLFETKEEACKVWNDRN